MSVLHDIMRGVSVVEVFLAGFNLYRYITTSDVTFFFMTIALAFMAGLVWETEE